MKQVGAVAQLDARRLWFAVVAAGLLGGLVPSFASGLGARVALEAVLTVVLIVIGAATGFTFGYDFAEGRGSFYFARPLSPTRLTTGKAAAVLGLGLVGTMATLASSWVSASDRPSWAVSLSATTWLSALLVPWSIALYLGLAAATQARSEAMPRGSKEVFLVVLRLVAGCSFVVFVFGLFADVLLRAFPNGGPVRPFFYSWVGAALLSSLAGVMAGRADRTRISSVQNRVMAAAALAIAVGVFATWAYVLHPDPSRILTIRGVLPSPDGRRAVVWGNVDRGDQKMFEPLFLANLETGALARLDADAYPSPRWSDDGGALLWSEATPMFFRPLLKRLGAASTFRIRKGTEEPLPLPVPGEMLESLTPGPDFLSSTVLDMLAAADGDTLAFFGRKDTRFVSRARGTSARAVFPQGYAPSVAASYAFTTGGVARTIATRPLEGGNSEVAFVDVDVRTGQSRVVARGAVRGVFARAAFDDSTNRALVTSTSTNYTSLSVSLLTLTPDVQEARVDPLLKDEVGPQATFLADGRVVALAGPVRARELMVFGTDGRMTLHQASEQGSSIGTEFFPGVISVWHLGREVRVIQLIEASSGRILRDLPGYFPVLQSLTWFGGRRASTPRPGTLGARLLLSQDRQALLELPAPDATPRRILGR